MTKLIHCADLHLFSKFNYLSPEKVEIRNNEALSYFDKMCDYAKRNNASGVLISGDLFDSNIVSPKVVSAVEEIFATYKELCFFLLSGNHDEAMLSSGVCKRFPSNVIILDEGARAVVDNVTVVGVSLVKGQELNQLSQLPLTMDLSPKVIVLHCDIDKSSSNYPNVKSQWLSAFSYVALGHIHQYQIVKEFNPTICYSGCLYARGFDEVGAKGFIEIDISERGNVEHKFVELQSRQYFEVEVVLSGVVTHLSAMREIKEQLQSIGQDNLVSVKLKGSVEADSNINTEAIHSELSTMFFGVKVANLTTIDETNLTLNSLRKVFVECVNEQSQDEQLSKLAKELVLKVLDGEEIKFG